MVVVEPLLELGVWALVMWVIATALAIALLMRYIADVFRPIPGVGGTIASALDFVAQAISSACGKLEHGVDKLVGASWHMLARYMDHLWQHLVWSSHVLLQSAEQLARLAYSHLAIKAAVHSLVKTWHGIEHGVKDLQRESLRVQHRVKVIERTIARGIGHDLRIHVKALEHELGRVERKVIPSIRSIADKAEADVIALRKWVKDNALVAGTAAFTGAVAWALASLGLGWLRCDSNPFNNNKRACGLWGDLAGLLGLVTAVLVAEDFEALVREMQALEGDAISVAKDLFNVG